MDILITYDISSDRDSLKINLLNKEFENKFKVRNVEYPLPESTVIINTKDSLQAAREAFDAVARYTKATDANLKLIKFVAVQFADILENRHTLPEI